MAEAFDPYHKWLGIPPEEQPPNHYRLLAINLFEPDPDVIASAADQRMGYVRTLQTGKHSAQSQKILNEISAARICLLNPQKKAAYDRELRHPAAASWVGMPFPHTPDLRPRPGPGAPPAGELPKAIVPPSAAGATPALKTPPAPAVEATSAGYPSRPMRQPWLVAALAGTATALCIVIVVVLSIGRDSSVPVADQGWSAPEDKPAVPDGKSPVPDDKPVVPRGKSRVPEDKPPPLDDEPPIPDDKPAMSDNHPPLPNDEPRAPDQRPSVPDAKLPVPDIDARAKAEEQLRQLLTATTPGGLLQAALADDHGDAGRFLLLKKAGDLAAAAGDAKTALRAVDELAKRYQINTLQMKAETLTKLKEAAQTEAAFRSIAEHSLRLTDEAAASGRPELAKRMAAVAIGAARRAEDDMLIRRATLRFLGLQAE